jgi:predicted  nucleic acid-binding Zn-ribbon protein
MAGRPPDPADVEAHIRELDAELVRLKELNEALDKRSRETEDDLAEIQRRLSEGKAALRARQKVDQSQPDDD